YKKVWVSYSDLSSFVVGRSLGVDRPRTARGRYISIFSLDYVIPRSDCYYKGNFVFFGVPDGEFDLTIRAQGYKPFVKKCIVKTGKKLDPMIVELSLE
ncbi:carboxypeptidase-like regulatory domain-containing protein, partial [Desulfobacter curvatus]|uniref:carboxypeptidase-like regulatory domain-containing protein n=1 Tax=Desulfobacter curvatus TaxID=2290 RepID=UPI001B7FA0FF